MTGIATFFLVWLIPFVLGTAISLACLKRRYGYKSLAIGSGYLLGSVIALLVQKYAASIELSVVLLSEAALAGVIAFFFRAKRCTIEEQRLEKASPNWTYFVSWCLVILLLYRWVMTYWDFSHFVPRENILTLAGEEPLWKTTQWGISVSDWSSLAAYHQSFLADNQKHLVELPWALISIALGLLVFGGLRYLGSRLLPAALGAYMVLSLPFIIGGDAVANALSIVVMAYYLWLLVLLAILIGFSENRTLLLIVAALCVVSTCHYWVCFIGVVAIAYVFGRYTSVLVAMLLAITLLIFGFVMTSGVAYPIIEILRQAIFIEYGWHFAVLSALISVFVLMFTHRRHDTPALELLLIGSLVSLFAMLGLLVFGQYDIGNRADIMSMITYFTPFLCLVSVTVYHLTTEDEESLPVI